VPTFYTPVPQVIIGKDARKLPYIMNNSPFLPLLNKRGMGGVIFDVFLISINFLRNIPKILPITQSGMSLYLKKLGPLGPQFILFFSA